MTKKVSRCLIGAAMICLGAGLSWAEALPGGTLDPTSIPKYRDPMVIPPAMPKTSTLTGGIDYYEIAVRQFTQQILPSSGAGSGGTDPFPETTVWSYGSAKNPATFNYPAFTIEADVNRPVRVKWINGLVDANGNYLPHLLPVDQTLHWANPPKDCIDGPSRTDCRGRSQQPYRGPVPIITHVHGAHVGPESDGFPEAWFLPAAKNIPAGYATKGSRFDQFVRTNFTPGTAVFQYPNDQPATTLWYHDHTLGMTRLNVYAGPAGFYLLRGGVNDLAGGLPGPAPDLGDAAGTKYFEIPIVVQDRSFNADGSLFYPDNRAFFEGLTPDQLQIPFIPEPAVGGRSDVSPIWNPEFFGNTMVVNGRTWPYLEVEPRRYRLRLLNGCNSRFLILRFDNPELKFWQIGAEGGFLPAPVQLDQVLMGLAERADVIVDFSSIPAGTTVTLLNIGPDEPFGGGVPGVDFPPADPGTTGQVMQFRVVAPDPASPPETSLPPDQLVLPAADPLGPATVTRKLSLNEAESGTVLVSAIGDNIVFDPNGVPFGPTEALLGTVDEMNGLATPMPMMWGDSITETPLRGTTEIWELHNFTEDAHPMHLHMVQFEVLDRRGMAPDAVPRPPESWETGFKDTVVAFPGEITRVKATFDIGGLYVWHCHIVEHEDNEMMRPYVVFFQKDINLDGCVNSADLNLLLRAIISAGPTSRIAYDLNRDGVLNGADARFLIDNFSPPGSCR